MTSPDLKRVAALLEEARKELKASNDQAGTQLNAEQRAWLSAFDGVRNGATMVSAAEQFAREFGLQRKDAARLIYQYLWEHA